MAYESSRPFDEGFSIKTSGFGLYRDFLKRSFDIAVILLFAVPVAVLLAILAVLVSSDGKSPFYGQRRVGRNGRDFTMWKLRSMVPDAEHMLEAYLDSDPAARLEWDVTQKLKNDPRITKVGRLIRKTSLDELPQLWNVIIGDMALIGPRPMMCSQKSLYPGSAYYSMRPGLSGYWQTSSRNESSFSERASFDTRYYYDISFLTDIGVLLQTVRVVVSGTGH